MPDPLFESRSTRLGLPYLFAGQSQKEGYVNEVTARLDALLFAVIEAQLDTPPTTPADGQCWLVGPAPTGDWAGQAGAIAAREGGNWLFLAPIDGLRVLDRATGQKRHYLGGWHAPMTPGAPTGGATIDAEARSALAALVSTLVEAGVLPDS